jgi:hypothetical protein
MGKEFRSLQSGDLSPHSKGKTLGGVKMARTGMNNDKALRDHILYQLGGGGAHMSLDDFIATFPPELCDRQVEGLPYTPWQILDHMRITQWDIIEFCRNSKHVSPDFPEGYWPKPGQLGTAELWAQTGKRLRSELKEMEKLVADASTDLFAKIPHGEGQTILREALLIVDHNAYHLGALAVIGRILKK